ncbi:MAG: tyrosine-type recombinase/integrase [Verrucomicrobia bacterium]|nr:tyrosine-type recombinase/integrase [Verrucomicrobiota bacterium]
MASLRKCRRSPFWYACYRDQRGIQFTKSTAVRIAGEGPTPRDRERDAARNRRLAKEVAEKWEELERGHPTENQIRHVMQDIFQRVNRRRMEENRTEKVLLDWVAAVQGKRAANTWDRYQRVVKGFLDQLGPRAQLPIDDVSVADVQEYVDRQAATGKSATSVRMEAKILSVVFGRATRQGLCRLNPAAAVVLPEQAGENRSPFTWEQVKALLGAAVGEWKTVIMLGVFTGARLSDCVHMRWKNVDLVNKLITFRPQKTARKAKDLVVPLHADLEAHLLTLSPPHGAGANEAFLAPELAALKIGGKTGLSRRFQEVMRRAGIDNELLREGSGAGRKFFKYGFHSLRHSFNSELMNRGVAQELRMKLSGHASETMNAKYSHVELKTLRDAVEKLPGLK